MGNDEVVTENHAGNGATIALSPYDPRWAVLFEHERARLEVALADWLVGPVEHIGSTSVPGLAAKPIIDMMAPVRSLIEAAAAIEVVTTLGYRHGLHRPEEAHYFFLPETDNWWERTHQLHLTEPTSLLWRRRIAFRDALRARADHRVRYDQLKRDLAQAHGADLTAYARDKDDFVNEVLGVRDRSEAPPLNDQTNVGDAQTRAAAGVVLEDAHGRVLLMRRRGEDTWGIPGGGLEPGETWAQAALRECREETGWQASITGLLGIYSDPRTQIHRYPSGLLCHFVGVVFRAAPVRRSSSGDGEAAELRWVTGDDLPSPLFGPDRPVVADALDPTRDTPVIG